MVFTLWDPTSLECLLKHEILKTGRLVADGCKIIVVLGKMYNDEIKKFNCKVRLISNTCMYKNQRRYIVDLMLLYIYIYIYITPE
jgi:hypothetical protein